MIVSISKPAKKILLKVVNYSCTTGKKKVHIFKKDFNFLSKEKGIVKIDNYLIYQNIHIYSSEE